MRDNVPLLGWLFLLGQCRDCGVPISSRYFFVELLTALLTVLLVHVNGLGLETLLYSLFVWGLIAITFIDYDHQIIPDEISVGGIIIALLVSPFFHVGFEGALAGALVGGGIFYALAIAYPGGMGGGDIKLMAAIGALLGWKLALLTVIIGSVTGASIGIFSMIALGAGRKSKIPFGPFLACGGIISILWGERIVTAYLETLAY